MADAVTVRLVCGCRLSLGGGESDPPYCPTHDEYRVQSVRAPSPRITYVDCDPPTERT